MLATISQNDEIGEKVSQYLEPHEDKAGTLSNYSTIFTFVLVVTVSTFIMINSHCFDEVKTTETITANISEFNMTDFADNFAFSATININQNCSAEEKKEKCSEVIILSFLGIIFLISFFIACCCQKYRSCYCYEKCTKKKVSTE